MDFDPQKNYYEILGVSEDATTEEIKKAFKKAAIQHHPDKKWGDKEKFQAVNEAHGILSDESKRQQYDAYRKGGFGGFGWGAGGFGGFGGADFGGFSAGWFDIGDLMGGLFGWGGGRRRQVGGEDIQVRLTIDFAESYHGVKKTIKYTRKIFDDKAKKETCPTCQGRGVINQQAQTPFGVMQVQNACPDCDGIGEIYTRDSKRIGNGGLIDSTETLEVEIPIGIKDDVFLKYGGMGHMGPGGQHPGDLYIKIAIKDMGSYTREGDDLYLKQEISLFDAVLGGKLTIDHPEGKLTISIPKGTQPHEKIKISGRGFGRKGLLSHRGDLYIIPRITIPKKLSKDQERLWKELQQQG